MSKQMNYFFMALLFYFGLSVNSNAQNIDTIEKDSIANSKAKQYFFRAYQDKGALSIGEKLNLLHKADSIFQTVGNWDYCLASKQFACAIYQKERAYEKLDQLSKEVMLIARSHFEKDSYSYAEAMNLHAVAIYENKRDFATAIPLLKEVVDSYKKNSISQLEISIIYLNLGICYQRKGDYDQAIEQFQKGLEIQIDSLNTDGFEIPSLYNQLGLCFSEKNQFNEASKYYKEGLEYATKVWPKKREVDQVILYLYQNLAALNLKRNQLEQAEKYISLALDFQRGQKFLKDAYSFQLQGDFFLAEEKFDAALASFQYSEKAVRKEFKDFVRHPDIGNIYFKIGNVKRWQNDLQSALDLYQLAIINTSLEFDSKNPNENPLVSDLINPLQAIDILLGKAETFDKYYHKNNGDAKDLKSAFRNYSLAVEVIAKTRQSFNADGSKYSLAKKAIPIFEGAIKTAYSLFEITREQKWLESAFQFAEQNKAAALLDAIQNSEALAKSEIPDSLLRKEYEGSVEIAFYKKLIYENSQRKSPLDLVKINKLKSKLLILKEEHQNLIDFFENHYPNYYALKFNTDSIEVEVIQEKLTQTGLIEFFVGENNIFVFTITANNIACQQIAKEDFFESDVENLLGIINTAPNSKTIRKSLNAFEYVSSRLYNLLLKNTVNKLPATIKSLIIIPDDLLANIPFSVLINTSDKNQNSSSFKKMDYLFKKYRISYNFSTAILIRSMDKSRSKASKKFIGFAPEFDSFGEEKLGVLPCNKEEVDRIAGLFRTAEVLKSNNARLEEFKENAFDYQIIHLATHSNLDHKNSSFNKIYFSDNYLSQNDLYELKLNADLVVLSACNSGVGELKKGEGVMSLSRGFTHAGCPSILMSLWSVDDCSTADIMYYYYQYLREGETKELALKNAKTKYLTLTTDNLQSHPYYWAGFVQYGDVSSVAFTSFPWIYLMTGLTLLLAIIFFFGSKKESNSIQLF